MTGLQMDVRARLFGNRTFIHHFRNSKVKQRHTSRLEDSRTIRLKSIVHLVRDDFRKSNHLSNAFALPV